MQVAHDLESLLLKTPLFVIGGPCVIESEELCFEVGRTVKAACEKHGLTYIFKASFDKANRTSASSFRGPGMEEGLAILGRIRDELGVPVLTDVHERQQALAVGNVVDILQVPAFLARQTDLLQACGETGKIVNIKKGQFMAPAEMKTAAEKVYATGNKNVLLTERGTFFGYGNLVNDFLGLPIMAGVGCPVVFDVTHSTQQPAGLGGSSGGRPEYAPMLARAAVAAGVQGIFLETHPNPPEAKSDATSMLKLDDVPTLIGQLADLAKLRATWK